MAHPRGLRATSTGELLCCRSRGGSGSVGAGAGDLVTPITAAAGRRARPGRRLAVGVLPGRHDPCFAPPEEMVAMGGRRCLEGTRGAPVYATLALTRRDARLDPPGRACENPSAIRSAELRSNTQEPPHL